MLRVELRLLLLLSEEEMSSDCRVTGPGRDQVTLMAPVTPVAPVGRRSNTALYLEGKYLSFRDGEFSPWSKVYYLFLAAQDGQTNQHKTDLTELSDS